MAHYDYWEDRLRPSLLLDAPADMFCYGMGERTMIELAKRIEAGENISDITDVHQTAYITDFKPSENEITINFEFLKIKLLKESE